MKVIFLLGPTSSGKSQMAIELAKELDGWVVGCDSRQVYKGLDIGTGKVEGKWKEGVYVYKQIPHYLIDFVDPSQKYDIKDYQQDFTDLLKSIITNPQPPYYLIVCGGTGFWSKVASGYQTIPKIKPEKEIDYYKLKSILQSLSLPSLQAIYDQIRSYFKQLELNSSDSQNSYRLQSHILNYEAKRQSWLDLEEKENPLLKTNSIILAIDPNNKLSFELNQNIAKRTTERFHSGLVQEVQKYLYLGYERLCELGLEYRLCYLYVQGFCTENELIKKLIIENQRLAKNQLTYLKGWKEVIWVKDTAEATQAIQSTIYV